MDIELDKINDRHYIINGKTVQKDMNENWVASQELTPTEMEAFKWELRDPPNFISQTFFVLKEVHKEREKQEKKWGQQNHTPMEWIPILGEEVGEVNKACLETYFGYKKSGAAIDYSEYRKELIQVAAVAVAMVESLDRNWNITK